MHVAFAMCFTNFRGVYMRKPVISSYFSGYVQYKPSERITLIGIGIHSPVLMAEIFIDRADTIYDRSATLSHLFMLFSINYIKELGGTVK